MGQEVTRAPVVTSDREEKPVPLSRQDVCDIRDAILAAQEDRAEYASFLEKHPDLDDYSEDDREQIEAQEERWANLDERLDQALERFP